MKKQKFTLLLYIFWWCIFLWILIYFFIFLIDKNKDNTLWQNNISQNSPLSEEVGNYYETTTPVITTPVPDKLEEKLIEEGKIAWVKLSFDQNGFKETDSLNFPLQTNIKLEIDAWNTWLPDGTFLDISIPWANFQSSLSIAWRYRYSVYFQETWIHDIIIKGASLKNGLIKKSIQIR